MSAPCWARRGRIIHLGLLYAANVLQAVPLLDFAIPKVDVFHASNQIRNPPRKHRSSPRPSMT